MSEKNLFEVVCVLSAYVFAKEHYNDSNEILAPDDSHVQGLANMLAEINCYVTVPDKARLIKQGFKKLVDLSVDGLVSETKLFEYVQSHLEAASKAEKTSILNAVIYTARKDRKVSLKEKEFIQQVAHCLGLNSDYNAIIKEYANSGIKRSIETWKILSVGLSAIAVIGIVFYLLIQNNIQKVNVYDEQSVAFSNVSFNRFIIYTNKFGVDSNKFRKQAVFYLSGTAEISFNPENLQYNPATQIITYSHTKPKFEITTNYSQAEKVDEIKPEQFSEEEAKKAAIVVGLVSAGIGAKAASSLSSYMPPPYNIAATAGGAVIAGAAGYALTSTLLNGASLSKEISPKEEQKVLKESKTLIRSLLTQDPNVILIYQKSFKKYLTSRYKRFGLSVKDIKYEVVK